MPVYETKVGRAYGRGCLRSCLAALVGGVLGVALVAAVLIVARGGDIEPRSPRLALALALPFALMLLVIAAAFLFATLRARRLDRAFAALGLEGRSGGPVLRGWHGEVAAAGGRRLDAWVHRGPTLELYLACRPATRGVIHRGGRLIRAVSRMLEGRRPLEPSPLPGASVYADDPEWLTALLARPAVARAVGELLRETPRAAAALFFAPDAIRYMRRFFPLSELGAEALSGWLAELRTVAEAVDAAGASADAAEPSRLETWSRLRRDRHLIGILALIGAIFLLLQAALFLFAWLNVGTP